jgi:Glycosyl hydrolase family 12
MIKNHCNSIPYLIVLAIFIFSATAQVPANAVWQSTATFGSWSNGGYSLTNDVWGSGAGTETIWAISYSDWGVVANHPNTGGVKSYPHCGKMVNQKLSALKSVTSIYSVTVPSSGSYETAYDIWCNNNAYEIMVWGTKTGAVGPIGSSQGSAVIGADTWTAYKGSNGSNQVFSFLRTANISTDTIDVLAVLNWIETKGWFGDVTLGDVEFGFEITSSSGGLDFNCNNFSVSFSTGTNVVTGSGRMNAVQFYPASLHKAMWLDGGPAGENKVREYFNIRGQHISGGIGEQLILY